MSVKHWLESLAMTQYHESFLKSGFDTLAKCSRITDSDLDRIGIVPPGHRRRLLSHVKTAQDFSTARSEVAEEKQTLPEIPEKCPSSEAAEIGDLIDLGSPDIQNAVDAEPRQCPIDIPPKMRRTCVDDILGALDGSSDSDRKRPIPLPRQSAHVIRPVPKPRMKKPSLQHVLGVTSHSGLDSTKTRDDSEGSKQLNCGERKVSLDGRNLDDSIEKISGSTRDDSVTRADVPSDFVSCLDGEVVEPDLSLALDCDVVSKTIDEHSLCETDSPDRLSVLRLPVSASYEGDVEDMETPGGEDYFGLSCPASSGVLEDDAIGYTGIWNLTSGAGVGQRRHEIRSDISFDEIPAFESRGDENTVLPNVASTVPIVPPALCSDATVPAQPQLSRPPPVPTRKLDLKCSTSAPEFTKDPKISSTRSIVSDVETYLSDRSSKPPVASSAVLEIKMPAETTGEGMVDRPRFPMPPSYHVPAETSEGSAELQQSCSPPHPPGASEHRRILQLPFPPSTVGTVSPLVGDVFVPLPVSSSIPDSLDVRVLVEPAQIGPPPLPPKVSAPVTGPSEETPYLLASCLEDEELNDEVDFPGDASFAESDDTLSDGGEFYDIGFRRPSNEVLRHSIPIISSTSIRQTSRKGFLYKLISKSKKLAKLGSQWQKRWVDFANAELRYFSSNKSFVSKRIIPLCTMINVETEIKTGDLHPYCFRLKTVDRVYTFAADDVDDMSLWASIIMQAIIHTKNERINFIDGGDMSSPDIQGYVRMEGSKCKRYLVVKKAKFCFYNTINDFKSYTPIHRVEMQLASVKEVGRFKLQLFTPHVAFMLIFESQDELNQWKDVFEDSILQGLGDDSVINEVYVNHSNRCCADCEMPDPEWSAINLGITLCKFCAGVHRSFSWSKIRSLRMDSKVWRPTVRQLLIIIGNDNSNSFWEWKTPKDKIDSKADPIRRKDYLMNKYCEKQYCRFHPLHGKQDELNEALCKMVQFGNVLETLELVFSGAEILCSKNNETPIQLARKAKQTLQEEFLSLNGGDLDLLQSPSQGTSRTSGICHRGFLLKTGSNVKGEFLRRWCTLENGVFSYFDTEKSTAANDVIEKKDMLSIGIVADERYDYTFEVGTTKQGGRMFLFAAECNDERMLWMTKLAKVIANISPSEVEKITSLDRGGNVYFRWGTSREWVMTWAQISHKMVKIFNKKDCLFEEIDLRKAKSIKYRQLSERCVESFDDGPPFVVDLRNAKNLYIQGDLKNETERWFSVIQKAITEADRCLANQSLTSDNVPVIVEKCIGFVVLYGLEIEGIYRLNGQHSKVTQLLGLFMTDACGLVMRQEEFQVHDVANTLKRFFRSLDDPLLTHRLYKKWIEAAGLPSPSAKLMWFKSLLKELPQINYCTLKQVITHLARVAELEKINKMTIINLASIFGPVLMRLDMEKDSGYGATNLEITVVRDLIENHLSLFEVKEEELEQEKKIEEARKRIEMLNNQPVNVQQMQDVLIGVHVNSKDGDVISLKVSKEMRAEELQNYVIERARLDASLGWSLFEVICNGELERPLHYMEGVVDVTLKWSNWPIEFCRDNYLCLKKNYIHEKILLLDDPHPSMFCELKYTSKKGFHKYCFEFSRYCLSYRTSAKASCPAASWNVEDLTIYVGCQKQRSPTSKWCFSFISTGEQLVSPFFGHCICCSSDEELYRWLSVLLRAQHPEGLVPNGSPRVVGSQSCSVQIRPTAANADPEAPSGSPRSRWLKPMSIFQKLNLK